MDSLTQNTLNQENAIKNFLRDYLNAAKDGQTVNSIISRTCGYYDADRVCVAEINPQRTEISVTYEHNRDGISPLSESLRRFSVRDAESCLKMLEEKGEFYIPSLEEYFAEDLGVMKNMFPRDVSSIAVAPLVVNGTVVGCLRLDNPRCHFDYLLLLSIIASACCTEIANKRLEDTNKALIERMKIIQSMSEIYTSVYYIDLAENSFVEITSLNNVHNQIGAAGIAQERLNYFCKNMMTEDYTSELLDFVNLKTLGERLSGEKNISREFLCTVPRDDVSLETPYWAQCSFIEVDRDKGQLAHVVFATQTIHEFKTKELNTTKKLQEANTELSELLEAEKKHTAIINSLSSVFFSLYYINVEENTFQGIFSRNGLTKTLGEKDNAGLFMKSAVDTWVNDEFKDEMRIFTDIATVDERLGDKRIISMEYEDITGKWVRCSIISAEKNEFGRNVGLICGFRDITAERERRETLSNLIQALALSYQNVYAVNMDTNEAVCYRMNSTIKSRYGQEFAIGDYELNIKLYVENDVYADDRRLFDKISTIEGVKKLLEGKTTHSFNYRVFRDGKISYFECQVVKPNDKRNEFAVGFKNVDDEKKQEIAQQKKIEEAFDAAEKANKKLRYEMAIAGTLSKDYPDVVLLDLANDTATTIKRHGVIIAEDNRVQRRSYNQTWDNYVEKYVIEEDREALRAAVSIPSVQGALRTGDEYVCSYRVVYDDTGVHYFQALFIRMFSAFFDESQIILGFRNVDAIVEEERKNIKIQEEQLSIIGALSQEYHSLFKIEADTGEISLYRTDGVGMPTELMGKLMENGSYESVLAKYIETFIVPEDRDRIREATTLEVLAEKVPEKGLYKL
ncbi:MAG: GAF domain-containing protein, partial [Oscillospiraceae bacterium]